MGEGNWWGYLVGDEVSGVSRSQDAVYDCYGGIFGHVRSWHLFGRCFRKWGLSSFDG